MKLKFGDFFRERRLNSGLTLRQFCNKKGYDAGYISRLENGLLPPPKDAEKLKALAVASELEKETEGWVRFFDLAAASREATIPEDIRKDFPEIQKFLPAFFRTLRKKEISDKDIKGLLHLLTQNESKES
ncbi:transcriptional regulator [Candidatus Parcubacteria bacterium]|nr:transcriptional regulator [Candidatus Parcubacteria bacterium]